MSIEAKRSPRHRQIPCSPRAAALTSRAIHSAWPSTGNLNSPCRSTQSCCSPAVPSPNHGVSRLFTPGVSRLFTPGCSRVPVVHAWCSIPDELRQTVRRSPGTQSGRRKLRRRTERVACLRRPHRPKPLRRVGPERRSERRYLPRS